MKFDYFKIDLPRRSEFLGGKVLRPIIPLTIIHGGQSTVYTALVDSGADFCVFDAQVGEYLGLDIRSGLVEKFSGIEESDGIEAFFHDVVLKIGGWEYKTKVGFSYNIANQGYAILGQKGFFEMFAIKFDYKKGEIELIQKPKK